MVIDTQNPEGGFFTCRQIAKLLHISPTTVSCVGRAQKWPGVGGNKWKVPKSHVKKLESQHKKGALL